MNQLNHKCLICCAHPSNSQRGAVLILTMLVLLVLVAVVTQIWVSADVDKQIANYEQSRFPIRQAALGAFMQAKSILLQDLEGSGGSGGLPSEGSEGQESPGGENPLTGPGGEGNPLGDPSGGGSENYDSIVDTWARSCESLPFASNVEVITLIRDEDAKLNILSIVSEDETLANASKERLVRLIDLCREGTKGDLSSGTAHEIVDALCNWMTGDREADRFPFPLLKNGPKDLDESELEYEQIDFPLTVEEFVLCPEITNEILFGYIDDEARVPGLIEFITVYSNLIMDDIRAKDENSETGSDPEGGTGGDEMDATPGEGKSGSEAEAETVETNNGLVNVNTASNPVLKSLLEESKLSYSIIDQIDEFRQKAIEAWEDREEQAADWGDEENTGSEGASGEYNYDEDNEDFIFKTSEEVFDRVEKYFETTFSAEIKDKEEFTSLLAVVSNVFTIYIKVKTAEGNDSQIYRAVVWRKAAAEPGMTGQEGSDSTSGQAEAQIIILVPLEEYNHPIPYFEGEEEELEEQLSDY